MVGKQAVIHIPDEEDILFEKMMDKLPPVVVQLDFEPKSIPNFPNMLKELERIAEQQSCVL
jgi:uncharacterized protein (UPF0276 family)